MKMVFEEIKPPADASLLVHRDELPVFDCPFHFHPEVELTLIEGSCGTRLIGGCMERFEPGDLVLIGANLPHWYYNDPAESLGERWARSVVVQFRPDFLGKRFWLAREMAAIHQLLELAGRGLKVVGDLREEVAPRVEHLPELSGLERLLELLAILHKLAAAESGLVTLDQAEPAGRVNQHDALRLEKVFRVLNERFTEELALGEVATAIGMTPTSFSRFFRQKVGKTFQSALIETRIIEASQQLLTTDLPVTEICYACGFNNLSNFNRQFKRMKGVSPRAFRAGFAQQ